LEQSLQMLEQILQQVLEPVLEEFDPPESPSHHRQPTSIKRLKRLSQSCL
jgi:hypothetical protein